MKPFFKITLTLFTLLWNVNNSFGQIKISEKELIGNWKVTGGTGPDFDKEMVGEIFTFDKEHKISRIEEGEKIVSEWKFENNIITVTHDYNDGKNDPEIETLTVISFDGKKLTVKYDYYEDDDNFNFILEKTKAP